jgi:cell division protein FtsQ
LSRFRLVRARRGAVSVSWRRPPLRVLAMVAAGLVLLGVMAWIVYGTSVLGVRRIEVNGTTIVDAGRVRAAAAVVIGTPLARVDTDAVAARVGALPPVASVDVSRSWPGTLVIDVTERVPVAVVATPAGFVVVDATGVVFNTVAVAPAGVVTLKVASPGPADPSTVAALHVLAALTPQLRAQLAAISATTPTAIRLELTGGRAVIWGGADQSEVKARVATALLGRPGKTIDVSAPEVATTS